MLVDKFSIQTIEWAGIRSVLFFVVVSASLAVVGHFVDVVG